MPNRRNYQKELEAIIKSNADNNKFPRLLLHSCCAPCSSYCLEYLAEFFDITLLYFNPNIFPADEYTYRIAEQKRLIDSLPLKRKVEFIEGGYEPEEFFAAVSGLEDEPEGGRRCEECWLLRLEEAAACAKEGDFDYFTTTLSISPLKSAEKLNNIGERLAEEYGVRYLFSDFKKRGGYQRSIELSKEYNLYRQNYCGCVFSRRGRE